MSLSEIEKDVIIVKRTAIQEWVKYQAMTASLLLVNGSILSFIYPYGTFPFSAKLSVYMNRNLLPFGPSNQTGEFPLAPPNAITGHSLPLLSFIALICAVFCFVLECLDIGNSLAQVSLRHYQIKALFYGLVGLYVMNQFTLIPPATFLFFSSVFLFSS